MSQESYRQGEHVTVRAGKKNVSKPSSGVVGHSEKGEMPKLVRHKEFAQENDQHDGAQPFVKSRHEKPDQKSEKGSYLFLSDHGKKK